MEGRELRQRITEVIQKYRYAALILLAGILLMLIPTGAESPEPIQMEHHTETNDADFETRLEGILSLIDGAGKVRLFLSQAAGEKTLYQMDEDISAGDIRRETVLITESDRREAGLIQQINPPLYQGAIVLCQGADDPAIRLSITQAVARATGLGTNQISVLKMK